MKNDTTGFNKEFTGRLQDLKGEYILGGCSREGLFHLAGEIRGAFAVPGTGRPGRKACVCSDKKEIIMAAILAALAGGPELIIPHALSEPVIDEILKSQDCLLVAETGGRSPFPGRTVFLDGAKRPLAPPSLPPDPDRTLLSLFTGGSTGRPKIWRKTARNLFGEAQYLVDRFGITGGDLVLATVPPRHIYGLLFSVLVPFLSGARVIDGTAAFPGEIISAVDRHSATVLVSVPIHYRVLKAADFRMPSLRTAFSSAGALAKEDADYFYGRTGIAVNEIYGSTETGGVATRRAALGEEVLTPFENVGFRIEKGVLKIKSDFISPDLPKDAGGYFTTSDRVRRDGGGFVLLGRVDDIVKVAGKRVDLAEIQQAIKKTAGVSDARVFAVRAANGRQNEIAAIVAGGIEEAALRAALGRVLEPSCLPRRIRIVHRLPSLPTGKLDREQLEKLFNQD
jgi:acyl-coenzyme A synthetase/AMP-(fatty) acid ligase